MRNWAFEFLNAIYLLLRVTVTLYYLGVTQKSQDHLHFYLGENTFKRTVWDQSILLIEPRWATFLPD